MTPADSITAFRATLTAVVAIALAVGWPVLPWWAWWLALAAWLFDAVDGMVARRSGRVTQHGARFDSETDAALVLLLSVACAPRIGWWVLAIGALHYLLRIAQRGWSRLRRPLAPSQARRVVGAIQGCALLGALLLPPTIGRWAVGVALVLLLWSFGRDAVALVGDDRPSNSKPVDAD